MGGRRCTATSRSGSSSADAVCSARLGSGPKESLLERFFRDQIRAVMPMLLAKWEPILGVRTEAVFVQRMKTEVGKLQSVCAHHSTEHRPGQKPRECLEYIVVHELVHLLEPTHNARFLMLMDRFIPQSGSRTATPKQPAIATRRLGVLIRRLRADYLDHATVVGLPACRPSTAHVTAPPTTTAPPSTVNAIPVALSARPGPSEDSHRRKPGPRYRAAGRSTMHRPDTQSRLRSALRRPPRAQAQADEPFGPRFGCLLHRSSGLWRNRGRSRNRRGVVAAGELGAAGFGRSWCGGIPLLQKFHPPSCAILILAGRHRRLVADGVLDGLFDAPGLFVGPRKIV